MKKKQTTIEVNVEQIRNIGVIAHIDAGKTTLTERFLYYSGKSHSIGSVDDGSSVMDYLDEERQRGITITASTATFTWQYQSKQFLCHLIDTPGHMDFTAEIERSMSVIDGAIVIISGTRGVEAQSEKVWHQSDKYKIPKIAFVNKLDRLNASYENSLKSMQSSFPNIAAIPITIPIYENESLIGIMDILDECIITYGGENNSMLCKEDINDDLRPTFEQYRELMILGLADHSDYLETAYLSGETISTDILKKEIHNQTCACLACPVLAGTAKYNIGVQHLLDAVAAYLPTPKERPALPAINNETHEATEINIMCPSFTSQVFKLSLRGKTELLYVKICSGSVAVNDTIQNSRTGQEFKVKRLLRLYSNKLAPLTLATAGDIVGLVGPKGARTGDTLCAVDNPISFNTIEFPEPIISVEIEPHSFRDTDRLLQILETVSREDPTLEFHINQETGHPVLSGLGELHLEITEHRITNEFNLLVNCGIPKINFREAFIEEHLISSTFSKELGHRKYFAEVEFTISPQPYTSDSIFITVDVEDELPESWLSQCLQSFRDGLRSGGNYNNPIHFTKISLRGITGRKDETNEAAIAAAVMQGIRQACSKGTVLLEPVVTADVFTSKDAVDTVKAFLLQHRCSIRSCETLKNAYHIECIIPLQETLAFGKELPQLTKGHCSFTIRPHSYQPVPEHLIRKINTNNL